MTKLNELSPYMMRDGIVYFMREGVLHYAVVEGRDYIEEAESYLAENHRELYMTAVLVSLLTDASILKVDSENPIPPGNV